MNDLLEFDPKDYYEKVLKNSIKENADAYFEELIKITNTDVKKNEETVKELLKREKIDKEGEKKLSRYRIIQGIMIFLIVSGLIAIILSIFLFVNPPESLILPICLLSGGILFNIIGFIVIFCFTRNKIKHFKEEDKKNNEMVIKYKLEAKEELRALNNGFSSADFKNIVRKTTDIFDLDDTLEPLKLLMMREVYNLDSEPSKDESIVAVSSGNIKTNPFIRIKTFEKKMIDKIYSGSITITWTELVSDGENGTKRVTRSQVLSASISRPAPNYSDASYMIYGNEAAPNLIFSRQPSGLGINPNESQINKMVKSGEKKLQKLAEKSISKGGSFQPLANSKFEVLFGATNRNHETEYRLLFTPLAQQNMVEIITQNPFGDDFAFFKKNKVNIVSSIHGRGMFEYDEEAFRKYYDVKMTKEAFINNISNLFASLYFELAPFLAIPLYQTTDGGKFDLKRNYLRNVSDYEAEAVVNNMNLDRFYPENASTEQILKVNYDKTIKNTDFFNVTSSAFETESRVEYVSKMGGDGRMHTIPIYWTEYIPVTKSTHVAIRNFKGEEKEYNNLIASDLFSGTYKKAFSEATRNKNFIGFFDDECYNYDDDLDDKITDIIDSFLK